MANAVVPYHFISDIFGKMSDDTSPPDITKLYDQEENIIKENSALVIDYNKNDSEEIFTLNVPVVSIRNEIENIGVAMEEDVEQDDAPPDKNITVAILGASRSSSEANIRKNLQTLLSESIQLNVEEIRKVVEMIMIKSRAKKVQKMSKEELIHEAESMIENDVHQSDPFCFYCLRKFNRIQDRNNHVKMIHEKLSIGKFNCGQCERSFMSESALRYHMESLHASGGVEEFKCNRCGKSFKHKIHLKRHIKLHSQKPYHCNLCEKEFPLKYYLTQHYKKVHKLVNFNVHMVKLLKDEDSGEYKCKICNTSFCGEEADRKLADHLVSKCKKKELFNCSSCVKKFTTQYNLEAHTNVIHSNKHEGFACESCSFVSKHKSNLNRHMRKMHTDSKK